MVRPYCLSVGSCFHRYNQRVAPRGLILSLIAGVRKMCWCVDASRYIPCAHPATPCHHYSLHITPAQFLPAETLEPFKHDDLHKVGIIYFNLRRCTLTTHFTHQGHDLPTMHFTHSLWLRILKGLLVVRLGTVDRRRAAPPQGPYRRP